MAILAGRRADLFELPGLELHDHVVYCVTRSKQVHRHTGCVERLKGMRAKIAADDRVGFVLCDKLCCLDAGST